MGEDVMVTVTGAIVNRQAMRTYEEAYEIAGDRASALADLHDRASSEDWARAQVAQAGRSWATHRVKFGGAVVPR